MRNLKKVLSLALCLVMLLGMMVVGAGAAEYKDADKIENTIAVDVLTTIGVVEGTDGNFNPTQVLNRAEGAAFIYRMLTGGMTKHPSGGATGFVDVDNNPDFVWAKGIIADLHQKEIISGNDPTHFDPAGELTGAAFGKMLLVALGYNANTQGYTGGGWEGNVIRDAYARGITVDGVVMTNKITRDDAAQMAFQTLEATMVVQKGGIQVGDVVIPGDLPKDMENKSGKDYRTVEDDQDELMQFCEAYFTDLKLKGDAIDSMNRNAVKWTFGKTTVGLYAAPADYTAYVVSGKTSESAVLTAMNKKLTTKTGTEYYVNGEPKANWSAMSLAAGDYVEVYVDSSNKANSVNVTHWTVSQLTNDPATKADGDDTLVRVPGVFTTYTNVKNVHGYENLSKGDVVLWHRDWDSENAEAGDYYIELADSFDGTLTAAAGTKYTIGGEKYNQSGASNTLNASGTPIVPTEFFKQSATWYTDKGGNIVWVKGEEVVTELAYVVDAKHVASGWDGTNYAKLLKMDGTVEMVTTDKNYSSGTDLRNKFVNYSVKDDVYTLTNAGTYAAGTTAGLASGTTADEIGIVKGNPNVKVSNTVSVKTGSETLFFVRDRKADNSGDKDSYTMFTGYTNVPSMDTTIGTGDADNLGGSAKIYAYANKSGYAKCVVVEANAAITSSTSANDVFYVVDDTVTTLYNADGRYGYSVKAVKNGGEGVEDLEFSFDPSGTVTANGSVAIAEGKAYVTNTYNDDKQITSYSLAVTNGTPTNMLVGTGIEKISKGTIALGSNAYGYVEDGGDDDTVVYFVTKAGKVNVIPVSELEDSEINGFVAIRAGSNSSDPKWNTVSTIFVQEKSPAVKAVYTSGTITAEDITTTTSKSITIGGESIDVVANKTVAEVATALGKTNTFKTAWNVTDSTNDIVIEAKNAGAIGSGSAPASVPTGLGNATVAGADAVAAVSTINVVAASASNATIGSHNNLDLTADGTTGEDTTNGYTWSATAKSDGSGDYVVTVTRTGASAATDATVDGISFSGGVAAKKAKYTVTGVNTKITQATETTTKSLTIGGHTVDVTSGATLTAQLNAFVTDYNANATGRTHWEAKRVGDTIEFTARTAGTLAATGATAPDGCDEVVEGKDVE